MKPATFTKSVDTAALENFLRKSEPGTLFTYSALSQLILKDVQVNGAGALASARRILLREGIRFATIRGEGLRRMSDSEIAGSGVAEVRGTRRRAIAGARRVGAVKDFDALKDGEKTAHNLALAILGVVAHFSGSKTMRQLAAQVDAEKPWRPSRESVAALVSGLKP